MKKYQVMYYAGAAISLLVGLWHFTVPWMFGWASYIPYETLVVPINYVNLCFSFLLSGLSLTVILWGKMVFAENPEAFYLYGFLLALWLFRVAVAVIYPCPPFLCWQCFMAFILPRYWRRSAAASGRGKSDSEKKRPFTRWNC